MDGGAFLLVAAVTVGGVILAAILKAPAFGIAASLGFLSLVDAQAIAQTIVTFGALVALIYSVGRTKVARKLWRRNVSGPITKWVRHVLREHTTEVVEPLIAPVLSRLDALEQRLPE